MKSVQTVISHSFGKAKTQVAKGSRKPRERTPEEQRRESFRESRISCACRVVYVGDHIFMQAAAAGQPASQPAAAAAALKSKCFRAKSKSPDEFPRKPRESLAKEPRKSKISGKGIWPQQKVSASFPPLLMTTIILEPCCYNSFAPGCCRKEICSVLTTPRTLIYRSITLLYNIPIEFPNRKRIAAKAAAKAPYTTTPSAKTRMQAAKALRKQTWIIQKVINI